MRIKESGDIFFAVSDRNWILDGASVHVSMLGFDDGTEPAQILDGAARPTISTNLRPAADITRARRLPENRRISFMGDTKGGKFDLTESSALEMLLAPNPNGKPNSDVVVPWVNGFDVARRPRGQWIIDFGIEMPLEQAALYERPFSIAESGVKPLRDASKRDSYRGSMVDSRRAAARVASAAGPARPFCCDDQRREISAILLDGITDVAGPPAFRVRAK